MERLTNIRQAMKSKAIEALLLTSPYNLRYATGFTGSTGIALITLEAAYFITDFRYTEQAAEECQDFEIVEQHSSMYAEANKCLAQHQLATVHFESDFVSMTLYKTLQSTFTATLEPVSGVIEPLRMIKTPAEIAIVKQAIAISDQAFTDILNFIRPGVTEQEVSNELLFNMMRQGATGASFDTIVASGHRSAMPHGVASNKVIETGDFVTLDFGCYYNGYVSDMTRTIAVGQPSAQLREIYDVTLAANEAVIQQIKAGMTGVAVDKIARDVISKAGYGDAFGHSLGHGIGLEIHEGPNASMKSTHVLQPGHIITDEPGIYLPGVGGVRIEDDILIKEDGIEVLTQSSKKLLVL
ncbi:M24 family metallopeptidase [Brochothrix campestris]|uniref:Aminopeptidase YpdF n=1 Tax=Brochothrix campestris FSL F6-1037 TaxID=1265861 RepID=W7CY05_9LIST|nr:aminopeptidase P family protein [Brochothrix campestris]EUJ40641.1 aminopeptidase YpdF [Brochothrix campestris FSL F6-1037]